MYINVSTNPSNLREYWEDHVVKVVKDAGDEASNNPTFVLGSPARQHIANWVYRGYAFPQESKAMIHRSFEVCGITIINKGLLRNDDFLNRIMTNIEAENDLTDEDDTFRG